MAVVLLVPIIVIVRVAALVTFIRRVVLPLPPTTGLKLNAHVTPDGQAVLKVTFSVKLPEGVIVMTVLPDLRR